MNSLGDSLMILRRNDTMQYAKLIPRNSATITMRLKASRIKLPTYTGERLRRFRHWARFLLRWRSRQRWGSGSSFANDASGAPEDARGLAASELQRHAEARLGVVEHEARAV